MTLDCVRSGCGGEYRFTGADGEMHRFECKDCGDERRQRLTPGLSAWAEYLAEE